MTDLPIIFSAPMVRALLDGRKTMTRRLLYTKRKARKGIIPASATFLQGYTPPIGRLGPNNMPTDIAVGEYWTLSGWQNVKSGDRLWVRESLTRSGGYIQYAADNRIIGWEIDRAGSLGRTWPTTWKQDLRPSIHMPRVASRLTLIVTAVKIERLQDISEEDAIAEGVNAISMADVRRQAAWSARGDFAQLWNVLHGPDAWDTNHFVVALSFRVIKANIDAPEAAAA